MGWTTALAGVMSDGLGGGYMIHSSLPDCAAEVEQVCERRGERLVNNMITCIESIVFS